MYRAILFDFDGTLVDTGEGIIKSVQYAFEKMGRDVPPYEELRCFIGPPLTDQFMAYGQMTAEQANQAVGFFRERYRTEGVNECSVYPGVEEMLIELCRNHVILGVSSSKPEVFIRQILDRYHLTQYFSAIVGATLDGSLCKKEDVIAKTVIDMGMHGRRSEILMVGDRNYDVYGARANQLDCMGVSYGYAKSGELEQAGVVAIADQPGQIPSFIQMPQQSYMETVKPEKKRENIFLSIWRILYPIGIHLGASVIVAFGAIFLLTFMGGLQGDLDMSNVNQQIISWSVVITAATAVVATPVLWLFYHLDQKKRAASAQLAHSFDPRKANALTVLLVILFAAAFSLLVNELEAMSGLYELFPAYGEEYEELIFGNQNFIVTLLCVGFIAPIAEEFVFRLLIFRRVRDLSNPTIAIIVSSLLFGIYHGNMVQFVYATIIGAGLAYIYERTRRWWVPILAHMSANILSCLATEYPQLTSWIDNGFVMLAAMAGELVLTVLCLIYFTKLSDKKIN